MKLGGMQKITLLDYPGKVACTVFTSGCNFRCPFCHNAPLVQKLPDEELEDESMLFSYLEKRKGILDGVAITGGEPLMQKDICEFIRKIKNCGFSVKLDTNGSYPEKLSDLIDEKLVDYVAMDVKAPMEKYISAAGTDSFNGKVRESIRILLSSDTEYEFRTTVTHQLHTKGDFDEIGKMISGAKKYFIQCFKDSGNILEEGNTAPSKQELLDFLETAKKYVPNTELRGVDL